MSETWIIKDTAPVDAESYLLGTTIISFTTNSQKATSIGIEASTEVTYVINYGGIGEIAGYDPGSSGIGFEWDNNAYKTLVFDTAPTGELLSWLQKNADKRTIINTLITGRTQADAERVKELAAKGFAGMTADEQAKWLAGMKGAYNASDLNRVGAALNYLAGRLGLICGKSIAWTAKTDWGITDIATASQAETYRQQIQDIRDALAYPAGTPDAPELSRLTYTGANDIERILTICEELIDNTAKAFRHTGAAECAAGGLLT